MTLPHDSLHQFLRDEFFGLTFGATLQRNDTYSATATPAERSRFRADLQRRLDDYAARYTEPVEDAQHVANIVRLADELSTAHARLLSAGRFRIGSAQKALNLYLKYLWCAGLISRPPHCPFDRRIIERLPQSVRCSWTKLDDVRRYARLVQAARQLAGEASLAEWELSMYNSVSNSGIGRESATGAE